MSDRDDQSAVIRRNRLDLLEQVEEWLERPMLILGLVWLVLIVLDLTGRTTPLLTALINVIWVVFIAEFIVRLAVAPDKLAYVRRNLLTVLSLLVPALRLFRITRVLVLARAARGVRLVKVLGSLNRGLRLLRRWLGRRRLGFVLVLTMLVTAIGAAGMHALERDASSPGFGTYGDSLWWTAMIITSLGSEAWPRTAEGRLLCLLLSVYGFAVFGYITGSFASLFIGQDAADPDAEIAGEAALKALQAEIAALRAELDEARRRTSS